MLSNKDLYEELKKCDEYIAAEKDAYKKVLIKCFTLLIKLVHNLRTNTVAVMKHLKIELVKPRENANESEE